jgi:hypothetical protein
MSAWGHQDTHNSTVEVQVMLALFSLLLHVTHHAFYEEFCLQMLSVISLYKQLWLKILNRRLTLWYETNTRLKYTLV